MMPTIRPASRPSASSVVESTPEDLATLRYLLDLTLQPIDRWDGFVQIEQFASSALRYQLNVLSYALAMAQHTRTPAFTGYLAEAQRFAIEKMRARRVWSYWAAENLVGHLRWDPDPIAFENVMYSGFFGVMVGMYESLVDDRFSAPGSLSLRWSEREVYDYDFASLTRAIERNMRADPRSPMYACEPHLIYPICNTFALNTLCMFDRLHGTDTSRGLVDGVRASLDRDGYLRSDGRFLCGRTARSRALVFPPTIGNDVFMAYWLTAAMPDLAERTYAMVRDRFLVRAGDVVSLVPGRRIDGGNYTFERAEAFSQAVTIVAAREFGDETTARALERTLERESTYAYASGARRVRSVSTLTNAMIGLARFSRQHSLREILTGRVRRASEGPVLAEVAYPEVLVARAVTDGVALDLVLRPGSTTRTTTIAIEGLSPARSYALSGATRPTAEADARGRLLVDVPLHGRTEVRVAPAP